MELTRRKKVLDVGKINSTLAIRKQGNLEGTHKKVRYDLDTTFYFKKFIHLFINLVSLLGGHRSMAHCVDGGRQKVNCRSPYTLPPSPSWGENLNPKTE